MKNFKIKVSTMALILSMLVVGASAQQGGQRPSGGKPQQSCEQKSPEKIAEIKTDKLDQDLDLTDSQEKKIYAINLKIAKEAAAVREAAKKEREAKMKERQAQKPGEGQRPNARPSREDMQAKMKERAAKKEAYHMEIMSNLKDEQKMKYAMMVARAEAKQQMQRAKKQGMQQRDNKGGRPQQGQKGRPQQGQQGKRPQPQKTITE